MTTNIEKWFAEEQARLRSQVKLLRSGSNQATAGKMVELRRVSQSQFSRLSGIDRASLNKLEHGKRNWTKRLVAKYAVGIKKQGRAGK